MNKIKVVALFGKSGAGKDTILQHILERYGNKVKGIVSCTTRPKRDYEVDGVDYHYLTTEEFTVKVLNYEMLEATEFNGWFYGTSIEELDANKVNIGVFNPTGVEALVSDGRLEVLPIEVYADDKVRLLRALNREVHPNCKEICRRFFADEEDFEDLDDIGSFSTIYNNIDNGLHWTTITAIETLIEDFLHGSNHGEVTSN